MRKVPYGKKTVRERGRGKKSLRYQIKKQRGDSKARAKRLPWGKRESCQKLFTDNDVSNSTPPRISGSTEGYPRADSRCAKAGGEEVCKRLSE